MNIRQGDGEEERKTTQREGEGEGEREGRRGKKKDEIKKDEIKKEANREGERERGHQCCRSSGPLESSSLFQVSTRSRAVDEDVEYHWLARPPACPFTRKTVEPGSVDQALHGA